MSEQIRNTNQSNAAGEFPWPPEKAKEYARKNTRKVEVKGHYLSRFGVWLLVAFVRSFSRKGAWKLGSFFGKLLYRLKVRRDVVMKNLDIVYGDKKTDVEKDEIFKGCWINIGRQVINYLRTPLYDQKFWDENVTMKGEHIVRDAFNRGKGVLILSMHYGAWELPGGKFGMSGYPISNIIKIIKNPVTEKLLIDARLAMNLGTIPHKNSFHRIKEGLQKGEGIIMAVDQNMKRSQGVFVDWFGHTASTIRSCAYLARETGAAVVAGYSKQNDPDHIEVVVIGEIPWEPYPDDPEKELVINTQNYIKPFENPIYDEPAPWLWLHRRWKVQPEGQPNPYK